MDRDERRKALAVGLNRLNEDMRTLAELSELSIRKAVESFETESAEEAQEVSTLDQEIYGLQMAIEKSCVDLLALHAPVARDLRTITTSLKITTDLDRIGRYASDIGEIAVHLRTLPAARGKSVESLARMADLTTHMVDEAVRAFVGRNADSVRNMHVFDDEVDDLHDSNLKDIVKRIQEGSLSAEVGVDYILVNRYLERISDHAVNIGQRVVYMVTGETPHRLTPTRPPTKTPGTA